MKSTNKKINLYIHILTVLSAEEEAIIGLSGCHLQLTALSSCSKSIYN